MPKHDAVRWDEYLGAADAMQADLPTDPLTASSPTQPAAKSSKHDVTTNTGIAAVLMMVGVLGFLLWYVAGQTGAMPDYLIQVTRITTIDYSGTVVWLNIAAWFSFFALWLRRYGLLVPGCLAGGIGIGEGVRQAGMLMETAAVGALLGGLVLGLCMLYLLGHTVLDISYRWPLYAAAVLVILGAGIVTTSISLGLAVWLIWIPLVVMSTGLYLGLRVPS